MKRSSNHALAVFAFLIGASGTNLRAATFSDHNWTGMGGDPGANDPVSETVVDASGNLYVAGGFTIIGDIYATNIAKWNGTHWSALGSGLNGGVSALAVSGHDLYAAGSFTRAGGVPATNIAKWNGTHWSALGSGVTGGDVRSLAVSGDDVYASGYFTNAGGNAIQGIAKWNGSSWSALGSGLSSPPLALAVLGSDVYAGGIFTNAGGIPVNRIARWDGSSWSALGSGLEGAYANVAALAVSGNDLYAAGYFSTAGGIPTTNMAKWNGNSWSSIPWPLHDANGQVLGAGVNQLTVAGNDLYAVGTADTDIWASSYYGYVVKWNGSSWSALGSGMDGPWYDAWDPTVSTVAVLGTKVYAGGAFTIAGNRPANCFAVWNGSEWSGAISSSGQSSVSAMAASSNEVYAAGSFAGAHGIVSNYVGRWNGNGWSPLGLEMIYNVSALAVSGSDVYAAGNFTNVGITANMARWNGSNWSAVGAGVGRTDGRPARVNALAVLGRELYAAGYFTTAGGVSATNIARWDGTNWSALGGASLANLPVYALAVSGSNLYVGGGFVVAGGGPGNYIGRWNGSSWSNLGPGVDGTVRALAVVNGDLYAGGDPLTVGGCVAKWNGTHWSGLGSGMTRDDYDRFGVDQYIPYVYALAASGNQLYVGGYFNTAGDAHANYIAKWDGSNWSALGSGMEHGVGLLAASDTELFVAGSFTMAGGKISRGMARARIGSAAQTVTTSNSTASIRFSGVTGYPYDVQRTTNLTPPITWATVNTVPLYPAADGSFTFNDTNAPPGAAYYRTQLNNVDDDE